MKRCGKTQLGILTELVEQCKNEEQLNIIKEVYGATNNTTEV